MGKEKKLTREKMISLNSALVGIPRVGILGIMQYEDRSSNYELTLKLMKLVELISPEQKAWEQINKTSPEIDRKDKEFSKVNEAMQEKLNTYLEGDSDVIIPDDLKLTFTELEDLWHTDDAKKDSETVKKEGRRKFTPQTIMSLQPILELIK